MGRASLKHCEARGAASLELLVAGEEPAGQLGTRLCTGPTGEPQG